jgi:hypothetical protein
MNGDDNNYGSPLDVLLFLLALVLIVLCIRYFSVIFFLT